MIARKITYRGSFTPATLEEVWDITRRVEITGEVRRAGDGAVELDLEGDPSMIKLVQHQVERRLKDVIRSKEVTPMPYRERHGLVLEG